MPPDQQNNQTDNPYDFIMNPQKPPRRPFMFSASSLTQRIIIAVGGLLLLIILISVTSSFLNKSNSTQKDKLIKLASTQAEIARVVDTASDKIGDKNLLYRAATVKITVESSRQGVVSAIAARGKKVKDKDINAIDPANDAALSQGAQNGHYDQTYSQLLNQQLSDYQKQLKDVYDTGNTTEKNIALSANNQLKLFLKPAAQ